jgi:hypothetical protein
MLLDPKMKKVKLLELPIDLRMQRIKDGRLSILIKLLRQEPRDSIRSSVSISTDHSISDQDFHSRELLSAKVPTMLP